MALRLLALSGHGKVLLLKLFPGVDSVVVGGGYQGGKVGLMSCGIGPYMPKSPAGQHLRRYGPALVVYVKLATTATALGHERLRLAAVEPARAA